MSYNPWFEPLGRRLLTLGLALGWLALETFGGGGFGLWFWLAFGATGFTVWEFFLRRRYGGGSEGPAQS